MNAVPLYVWVDNGMGGLILPALIIAAAVFGVAVVVALVLGAVRQ